MNPKTIAEVFRNGQCSGSQAVVSFICCAEEMEPDQITREVPEELMTEFWQSVVEWPDEDVPVLGLDGFVLKKQSIERLKAFYHRQVSRSA